MSIDLNDDGVATTIGEPSADERVARLVHPRAIRWLHWINFPLLFIMIWSGLRIYWAEDVYAVGIGSWQWFAFFPDAVYERFDLDRHLARGLAFHFSFGWLFVINGAVYFAYLAVTGEWRHIVPDRHAVREAKDVVLHDVRLKKQAPPQGKYNAAQRISYTVVLVMALIIVVSGFAIYKPTQLHPLPLLFGGYQGARLVHFSMTIGSVPVLPRPRPPGGPIGLGQLPIDGHRLPDRTPPTFSVTPVAESETHATEIERASS